MNKPELLAPAGNIECFKAAILAGADAVYLAGKRFGARAFATNFDESDLKWARKVTKALNKKLYITLNTIVFDYEWKMLCEALDFYEYLQPDSLIIQDLGIAAELRKRNSSIPLHLSTQGAWYGQGGIKQLQELGFTRIILPRETTESEIRYIIENSPFEIETFVHGAMCYSISGRCYWSATLGTRSGNRGTCAQPCRKEYFIENNKGKFLFSPKDLRLIDRVKNLKDLGVTSLKIEGRMKSPEYVYQVVSAYKHALDNNSKTNNSTTLSEVFSRENSIGFFDGIPQPQKWKTNITSGREGVTVAITTGKSKEGLLEVKLINKINAGDGLFWLENGEKKGAKVTWIKESCKSSAWLRGLPTNLKSNTELKRTSTSQEGNWEKLWKKDFELLPIKLEWIGQLGKSLKVKTQANQKTILIESSEKLSQAQKIGLEEGPIADKFKIVSDDFKVIKNDFSQLDSGLYINVAELKNIKRDLANELQSTITIKQKNIEYTKNEYTNLFSKKEKRFLRVKIYNNIFPFDEDISEVDEWLIPWYSDKRKVSKIINENKLAYWLPPILNTEQLNTVIRELSKLKHGKFICFGWEAFELSKLLPNLNFSFDWSFNISNLSALNYIRQQNLDSVFAKEWRIEEIPNNLVGIRYANAWNPLVSFTRFPNTLPNEKIATNSHNDKFFTINIGNGVTGMFLLKQPKSFKLNNSYQLDIALSVKENPVYIFNYINEICF